jgi:hypothetical protein
MLNFPVVMLSLSKHLQLALLQVRRFFDSAEQKTITHCCYSPL